MRLKHEEKMYPPRVKMTIPAHPGFNKLPVTFEGYLSVCQSLDFELVIPLAEDTIHKCPWPWYCSHDKMICELLYNSSNTFFPASMF